MPPKFVRNPGSGDYASSRSAETRALLEAGSDEEDFFLQGPNVKTNSLREDPKINRLQNQVDDVVGIMKDNMGKVIDRGDRLEDLQDKSDNLASNSDLFRSRSRDLRKSMWWKNCKMKIILVLVIVIILAVIIIPIIASHTGNNG
ncbi:vesicle-associated membrane protein 4-like [Ylistrum balloti]|uniref:vesicle-associated membrane protein 4-like n=1 Tax=Ylistrum balloti TaxID=509963 RepID=UPI002905C9EB|nr:vesicle-associated membrane protein 4-like [Ylistrum balloti]